MSAPRQSSELSRIPHSLSLKVLRFARPTLSTQHAIPRSARNESSIEDLSPSTDRDTFMLNPGLRLPSSFGSVHVGETFACTLCVNNDRASDDDDVDIVDVGIQAEMQTPEQKETPVTLELEGADNSSEESAALNPGSTLQNIVRMHLAEEGNYVLFVTVNYTEVQKFNDEGAEPISRRRSFRKLYRFPADHLIRVRVKTRSFPHILERKLGAGYAVEAQLEKLGDECLSLESVDFSPKPNLTVKSLNGWHSPSKGTPRPMLGPGGVMQAAFLVLVNSSDQQDQELTREGRVILGQISLRWRREMGEPGMLNTGWLSAKAP